MASHDRKLRYKALLENLSTLEEENDNNDVRMEKTASAVRDVQALLAEGGVEERVKHPGEGYLDSRVLRATSELSVRCSEAISGNVNVYDKHELAKHIKENPDFWSFPLPFEVPVITSLYGTFDATPPEARPKLVRRRIDKQPLAALKEPENVDRLEKTEEGSEMISRMKRFITKAYNSGGRKPLSYFHVVLNPNSFSASVENMYHLSFLVRDGMMSVKLDEEYGLPFITPVASAEQQEDQRDLADENQFIVSFDMQRWKEMVDAFKITKPMMTLKKH